MRRNPRSITAVTTVVGVLAGLLSITGIATLTAAPANALTNDGTGPLPETISADALPTPQTNGIVFSTVIIGDVAYAGGNFTKARPAGAAPGAATEVTRTNLLAFNVVTGALLPWAPTVIGTPFTTTAAKDRFCDVVNATTKTYVCDNVFRIKASPDKKRIYVSGDFTSINGVAQTKLAAFDVATGNLVSTFKSNITSRVRALAVTEDRVYFGGDFLSVNGFARNYAAAVDTTGKIVPTFAPKFDADVWAMEVSVDRTRIIVGGRFNTTNGADIPGMTSLYTVDGTVAPWASKMFRKATSNSRSFPTDFQIVGDILVAGGVGAGSGGFEGRVTFEVNTGKIIWNDGCTGDTQSVAVANGIIYSTSHTHNCLANDFFPQRSPGLYQRLIAQTLDARDPDVNNAPKPAILHVLPTFDDGPTTSPWKNGTWAIAADSRYVVVGGEFLTVNGIAQQSLTRFTMRSQSPKKAGAVAPGPLVKAASLTPGHVRISVQTAFDPDDRDLKYETFRTGLTTPIDTRIVASDSRDIPQFGVDDLPPSGTTPTYRVRVTDSDGNVYGSPTTTPVTVLAGTVTNRYAQRVIADGAVTYHRLAETTGTAGTDTVGASPLTYRFATSATAEGLRNVSGLSTAGPLTNGTSTAISFNGTTDYATATIEASARAQVTHGMEAWFRTPTGAAMVKGGTIVSVGNTTSWKSTTVDRSIVMDTAGRLKFATIRGVVTSTASYNDGQWHHVYASIGSLGLRLFVDGALVASQQRITVSTDASSILRIGGDSYSSWVPATTSPFFTGAIAEVATYRDQLSAAEVRSHFAHRDMLFNEPPVADATVTCNGLECLLDASASADADGFITGASWSVGSLDPLTGTSTRVVLPAAGTYPVTLTVTDDTGATAQVTKTAVAEVIPEFAADSFSRPVTAGWGTALPGGPWQLNAGTSFNVTGGFGTLRTLPGDTRTASLPVGRTDADVSFAAKIDQLPSAGTNGYVYALMRRADDNTVYRTRLRVASDGSVRANFFRRAGSATDVAIGPEVLAPNVSAASAAQLRVRTQAVGTSPTTLRVKVWQAGQAEPIAWLATQTDNTPALQGPGGVGVSVNSSTTNQVTATTFSIADFAGRDPGMNRKPIPAFTATCLSRACSFNGTASVDPDVPGGLTSYVWSFGDGRTATGATQSLQFATDGTYEVSLTVTDVFGDSRTLTKTIEARNQLPTAGFTWTCAARVCSLDASKSTDPDGRIVSYAWDLGDGRTASTPLVSVTYPNDLLRMVKLTVTDDYGATNSITLPVTAANAAPIADYTYSCVGRVCTFDATPSRDPDGTIASYAWNFGDGGRATGKTATRTFSALAPFPVRLTVLDNFGAADFKATTVTPANIAPNASFTATCVKLVCSFNASASKDPDGSIRSYSWNFANGTRGSGVSASATYPIGGPRTVTLTVTDNEGGVGTTTQVARPIDSAPTAAFVFSCKTWACTFDGTGSKDAEGPLTYEWLFGDDQTGDEAKPTHYFTANGTYSVTLNVTDLSGTVRSITKAVTVTNKVPAAKLALTCTMLRCTGSAAGSADPDGTIASYLWDLGDGRTLTDRDVSFSYPADATVTVSLTVTDDGGAQSTLTRAITATNAIGIDDFTRTTATGWGQAVAGGVWTSNANGFLSVSGGAGLVNAAAGSTRTISLVGASATQTEAGVDATITSLPTTSAAATFIFLSPRRIDDSNGYRIRARVFGDGSMRLATMMRVGGVETQIGTDIAVPGIVTPGTVLSLRTRATTVDGVTTVRAKVWDRADPEPAEWQVVSTDSTPALQAAGGAQIAVYQSATNTAAAVIGFDTFRLRDVS